MNKKNNIIKKIIMNKNNIIYEIIICKILLYGNHDIQKNMKKNTNI